jgi:hypothetical protein
MSAQVHVGDIGTVFYAIVKDETSAYVDISAASTRQMFFRKPSGSVLTKTASYVAAYTGADPDVIAGVVGKAVMQWTTINGDIDAAGAWSYQGSVVIGAGSWKTDIHAFTVDANLA